MPEPHIAGARRETFRALVEAFVPEAADLDAAGWRRVEGLVEDALAPRPARDRRRLLLLFSVLRWLPLLAHGRPLEALDPGTRARFLLGLQEGRVGALRRGVWGARTLAFLGYYGRGEAAAEVGWRAAPRGWEARR